MEKAKVWFLRVGGFLNLLGLIGLYLYLARDGGRHPRGILGFDDLSRGLTEAWFGYICVGSLLTLYGNGSEPVGRWCSLFDGLSIKPTEFYKQFFAKMASRKVEDVYVGQVTNPAGGLLESNRLYGRIARREIRFDVCASPVGTSTGVSWRCYHKLPFKERALTALPLVGWLFYYLAYRYTPYAEDQALLFQKSVQNALRETMSEICAQEGAPLPPELEFSPVLADLFHRW